MPQNLVSLDISADDLAAMDQAIATLETLTKPFITLSADDKSGLVKMGDKSVAFCQQTALVLSQNKDALPAGFDYTEMEDDLAAYAALQGRVLRIREVLAKMDDTQTAIGSDIMVAASEGYALMKLFGKAEGLSELQQAMRVRRPGRRRKGDSDGERRVLRLRLHLLRGGTGSACRSCLLGVPCDGRTRHAVPPFLRFRPPRPTGGRHLQTRHSPGTPRHRPPRAGQLADVSDSKS